jgi:hypothetical protein
MKTLILTLDTTGLPEWHVAAITKQMADWLDSHKAILPVENLVILPAKGDTRLYWLEGDPDEIKDVKELEKIKDRLKPILSVFLNNISLKKEQNKFSDALEQLKKIRKKQ